MWGNIQAIINELSIYNNNAEWFLNKLKTFYTNDMNEVLDDIISKTQETIDCFESRLNFGWFDKEKMRIKVTDELKYITSDKNKENEKCF